MIDEDKIREAVVCEVARWTPMTTPTQCADSIMDVIRPFLAAQDDPPPDHVRRAAEAWLDRVMAAAPFTPEAGGGASVEIVEGEAGFEAHLYAATPIAREVLARLAVVYAGRLADAQFGSVQ